MRAVSLFSGVGGFELGFERAGIRTVLQAERDPWATAVLRRHWPDVERIEDVRAVSRDQLRWGDAAPIPNGGRSDVSGRQRDDGNAESRADLIFGGFPCQDVSVAGKRAGLAGERTGLWSEFGRVLRDLRSRWVCAENVPGLLSSAGGRDLARILRDLEQLGYGWAYRILDARFFGVPQRRRRVFIVGCLGDGARAAQVLALCASCGGHPAPRREARQDVAAGAGSIPQGFSESGQGWWRDGIGALRANGENRPSRPSTLIANTLVAPKHGPRYDGDTETFVVADTVRGHPRPGSNSVGNLTVANTVSTSAGHHGHSSPRGDGSDNLIAFNANGYGEGGESGAGVRRLTPRECERLMGWPDDWTRWTDDGREIPDSHRYRLCGNGVVSTVAEWIGHRLVAVDAFPEVA